LSFGLQAAVAKRSEPGESTVVEASALSGGIIGYRRSGLCCCSLGGII
jgi:hypothetical protein